MELDAFRRESDLTQLSSSSTMVQNGPENDDSEEGDEHSLLDKPDHFGRLAAHAYDSHFTFRAVAVGSVIGTLLCVCNVYFGLQTGSGVGLSIPASLLGFAVFQAWPRPLRRPFTPIENVLVQTVASATGAMPLGCGFTGVMPAIEFLLDKSEGAPVDLSMWRLLIWGLGLNLFGVIYAVPLRREVIVREKLKFPTGTATAVMIKILHGKSEQEWTTQPSRPNDDEMTQELLSDSDRHEEATYHEVPANVGEVVSEGPTIDPRASMILLRRAFGLSGIYTLVTYFIPQIRDLSIFGTTAASEWLWTFNPSLAYIGQGMIMGPSITFPMLIGAVFGWAVLSPLAKKNGWAPGPVNDWENGSRGWIIWIALVIMLMDASINLGWFAVKSAWRHIPNRRLLTWTTAYTSTSASQSPAEQHGADDLDDAPPEHLISNRVVLVLFAFSLVLCVISMQIAFGSIIAPYLSVLAVFAAVILSIMGVRANGQTDLNPASSISKITQVFFALFTTRDNPHRILINLLAGQVADAGAGQAGDMMQDLKTGHLLKASPKAQFYGALLGSTFGALVAPAVYRIYTLGYELPGPVFPMPQAFIWIFTARLLAGEGLPASIGPFAISAMILFAILTTLRIYLGNHKSESIRKWQPWVPGGIPVAMGMYNPPSFTLARAVGGTISLWCLKHRKMDATTLIIIASGFILGEGIVSLVNLTLAFLGVPHF